ncbi:hypothetical protein DCAR_0728231 [Daucus carota subsp. sativus]|uniref:Uncharacterized protein n=1 Tax=Daucus carota subsp. sativus TaxID=79200 RepID=A0AAF1B8M8_DAUCS|nr:hypothetical protein DCAR_0728231 [Daucus carota subsp. sativus]
MDEKTGYEKEDGAAYAHLLTALAPELGSKTVLATDDPTERANLIVEQAENMDCKRYFAFVAENFQHRTPSPLEVNELMKVDQVLEPKNCSG